MKTRFHSSMATVLSAFAVLVFGTAFDSIKVNKNETYPLYCATGPYCFSLVSASGGVIAAESLQGQVLGAGAPIANSTVTLWAATSGPPAQLGQARTGADGRFSLNATTEGG